MWFHETVKRCARLAGGLIVALAGWACADPTEPVDLYVAAIDFVNDPEVDNRIDYEISGKNFDAPHLQVGERVFSVDALEPYLDLRDERRLIPEFDEPAPHLRDTPMHLRVGFGQRGQLAAQRLHVVVQGVLHSMSEPARSPVPVLVFEGEVDLSEPLDLVTDRLPSRTDLYRLQLSWQLNDAACISDCARSRFVTRHLIPTLWRRPRPEAPRYKRMLLWSAQFGAGEWPDGPPDAPETRQSEREISLAMLDGIATLAQSEGRSYGAFARPEYDGEVDGVDVWLDFPRSACGEFKFALMALIEYQGIDAQWGVLEFLHPASTRLSQYVTYDVPAMGRESQVWYHTNHAFAVVNGEIFDATYNGYAPTIGEFEDNLFAKFCYGQDEPCRTTRDWCDDPPKDGVNCIDNPPGYDPELGFVFYTGDSYN